MIRSSLSPIGIFTRLRSTHNPQKIILSNRFPYDNTLTYIIFVFFNNNFHFLAYYYALMKKKNNNKQSKTSSRLSLINPKSLFSSSLIKHNSRDKMIRIALCLFKFLQLSQSITPSNPFKKPKQEIARGYCATFTNHWLIWCELPARYRWIRSDRKTPDLNPPEHIRGDINLHHSILNGPSTTRLFFALRWNGQAMPCVNRSDHHFMTRLTI